MHNFSYLSKKETQFGFGFLFVQAVSLPLVLSLINSLLNAPLTDVTLNFIYFCINFLCAGVVFRRYILCQVKKFVSSPIGVLHCAIIGFILYHIASTAIGILIQYIYPPFINANDSNVSALLQENFALTTIGIVFLVPPVEELLYRTLIFGTIRKYSRPAAYITNIIFFGGIHIFGYIGTADPLSLVLSFLQYVPASLLLCWAYEHSGSIVSPILVHMAINLLGISLMR